jgi:hypothetical protein
MNIVQKFVQVEREGGSLGERQIRIIASDATIDRVDDVMIPEGCELADYRNNPIVLAQHNREHPIGNATISIVNGRVEALIDFAPKGISAKADEYCGLYKSGVLRAASVGFEPIEAEPIKGGGTRFIKWKLMELSCVSVPANPSAVTLERSLAGAAKGNAAAEWKVGASRNLLADDSCAWDEATASKSIFELCGFDGAAPDVAKARKAFLIYDAANPKAKGSYRLPFAKVANGRLTFVSSGVRAAAALLDKTDLPDDVKEKASAVIDHYEGKMNTSRRRIKIKGLYEVAELARAVAMLGYIHDSAKWEAEVEQDASKLPEMLATALRDTADALVAMTVEEVGELLAGRDIEPSPVDVDYVEAGATPQIKAMRAAFRKAGRVMSKNNLKHVEGLEKCLGKMLDCHQKAADAKDGVHEALEELMTHGTSAGEHVKALLKSAGKNPENDEDDLDNEDVDEDADQELAAPEGVRKRAADVLELSKAV